MRRRHWPTSTINFECSFGAFAFLDTPPLRWPAGPEPPHALCPCPQTPHGAETPWRSLRNAVLLLQMPCPDHASRSMRCDSYSDNMTTGTLLPVFDVPTWLGPKWHIQTSDCNWT